MLAKFHLAIMYKRGRPGPRDKDLRRAFTLMESAWAGGCAQADQLLRLWSRHRPDGMPPPPERDFY